jgi:hypothetical protein
VDNCLLPVDNLPQPVDNFGSTVDRSAKTVDNSKNLWIENALCVDNPVDNSQFDTLDPQLQSTAAGTGSGETCQHRHIENRIARPTLHAVTVNH